MALYKYTGAPDRIWPDIPVTPEPGDVVDWGDREPDVLCWEPSRAKKPTRDADNAAPDLATALADVTQAATAAADAIASLTEAASTTDAQE